MDQNHNTMKVTDGCNEISSHTDAPFTGGQYVLQAGFVDGEIAAASYTVPASEFPLKIDLCEMIFATSGTTVQTVTEWSILIWEGTPASGTIVAEYMSDGDILPHISIPPGSNGVNVQFSIDPNEPIVLNNTGGSNTFSIGYRIDKHNNPSPNPCFQGPPTNSNAFPCTDTSGLLSASGNWLKGINCGPFGCPPNGGWSTFSALAAGCKPSGDWVLRATWSSLNCQPGVGACCLPNGTCQTLTLTECQTAGGSFKGEGTSCSSANCPTPTGACCFGTSCLNLTQSDCQQASGTWIGPGTQCSAGNSCPTGACCLPNGSCSGGITAAECQALGGNFKGAGTTCAGVSCPPPLGACCLASGGCLLLSQADCGIIPSSSWAGPGTNCLDGNSNGKADACEVTCTGDINGDGKVDQADLGALLTAYNATFGQPAYNVKADFDKNGTIDQADLGTMLQVYGTNCP